MSYRAKARKHGRQFLAWTLLYSLLWLLLGAGDGWLFGVLVAIPAALVTLALKLSVPTVRLAAVPGFIGFFLVNLVAGGWDVAWRALRPSMPLHPVWVYYPLRCRPDQRLALSVLVGLLPGTLATRIDDDRLLLHVLDNRQPWQPVVARIEQRLMAMCGDLPG